MPRCGRAATGLLARRFAARATPGVRFELQTVERNRRAAVVAQPEVWIVDAAACAADQPELDHLQVVQRQIDLAISVALRRVVSVLQQHLARMFGARLAALLRRQPAVEFLLTQEQRRIR